MIKKIVDKIKATENGKKLFINAIGMNSKQINALRELIKKGLIVPDTDNYAIPEQVASGEVILPQNFYRVCKGGV